MSGGPRPLYARVLRLRHLHLRSLAAFLLFEGSVAFAILLVLADLVPVWAVVAIPVAVAVMVKLNDLVAGALNQPLAVAQLRTPRPRDSMAVGRSPVRYSRVPTRLEGRATVGPDGLVTGRLHADGEPGGAADEPPAAEPTGDAQSGLDRTDGREPRTWAIARVLARGRASVRSKTSGSSGPDVVRPDGADRRNRGNTGRFGG